MKNLFFWQNWERASRLTYLFLLLCFVASVAICILAYLYGAHFVLPVQVKTQLEAVQQTLGELNIGVFNIPVKGEVLLSQQHYEASYMQIPLWIYTIYGLILAFCATLIVSIITQLRSVLWYAIGMTSFILFLATLNLDYLGIFRGTENLSLLICLVLYIGLTFYLYSFSSWSLLARFLVIGILTSGLLVWCISASVVQYPVLFLVNYGLIIPVILTLLFITMTAHDIPYAIFHFVTNYNKEGRSDRKSVV